MNKYIDLSSGFTRSEGHREKAGWIHLATINTKIGIGKDLKKQRQQQKNRLNERYYDK